MIKSLLNIVRFIAQHPLNKNRKLDSILMFAKWQIATILIGSRVEIEWVNDAKFLTKKGEPSLTGNLFCGLMEYEDMAFMLHYLREDDEFFDIGANVGSYTILASGVVGCKSHAFEPLPDTFDRLIDQLKINRIEDLVSANNKGVGFEIDTLEFTNNLNATNHVNTDPINKDVTRVDVTTMDDEFSPSKTSFVKIDVEGYEFFVLNGGKKFFNNIRVSALIIEMNGFSKQFGTDDDVIDSTIREYGFIPISYEPMSRSVKPITTFNKGGNTIYIRDIDAVKQRCKEANSVTVHTADGIII